MATSRSNPINPNPCEASPEEIANWTEVRELFEQVFPKLGCATENWRMTGSVYPSHPSYPACPTKAQLCTVAVTYDGENFTVLLPCPRNRDPNFETGDSVLFQQDVDGDPIYIGGHDDPIGTVKWFHGLAAEVPKGWYWITNSAPGAYNTRTGRWAAGFGKYVKNYWAAPGGTDPTLGTLGMHCDGADAVVTVADHDFTPNVSVADHTHSIYLAQTGITIDCDASYIGEECLYSSFYFEMPDHVHFVDLEETLIGSYFGTPVTVASKTDVCTDGPAENTGAPPCQDPVEPVYTELNLGCHDHDLYMDCDLFDPGHSHSLFVSPHEVTEDPINLPHVVEVDQMHLPRVFKLLIERLNNSANVAGSPTPAGAYCGTETEP